MIEVLCINLDSRPDRREFMERQFADLKIAATRVRATTPDELPMEKRSRSVRGPYVMRMSLMSAAELACTASHLTAWRLMLDRGLQAALILEDDARLSSGMAEVLADPSLAGDWYDVLKVEGKPKPARLGRPLDRRLAGRDVRRLVAPYDGSGAYIITHPAAARALNDERCWNLPIDEYLFNRPGIYERRVYQVTPALAVQERFVTGDTSVATNDINHLATKALPLGFRVRRRLMKWAATVHDAVAFSPADRRFGNREAPIELEADLSAAMQEA